MINYCILYKNIWLQNSAIDQWKFQLYSREPFIKNIAQRFMIKKQCNWSSEELCVFLRNSAFLVLSQSMSQESKCIITMETSFSCLDTREFKAKYMTELSDNELDAYLSHHTLKNIHTSTEYITGLSNPTVTKVFLQL